MEDTNGHGGGAKDLVALLKKKPALLIAVIAGIILVVFLLWQKGNSASTTAATSPATGDTSQGSGANLGTLTIQTQSSGVAPLQTLPSTNATSATLPYTPTPMPPTQAITPNPSVNSTPSTNTSSVSPYYGLLGPGYNFASASQKFAPPSGYKLISGGQDRVWEVSPQGVQTLVTSGYGPGVTNSGYKAGQGPPTPGATAK